MSVFAGLTMGDLVALIGHDQWKGVGCGDSLIVVNLKEIDATAFKGRLEEAIGPCDVSVKNETAPGGIGLQMLTIRKEPKA